MRRLVRERWIMGTATAIAAAVPLVLLWPAPPELHDQPPEITTSIPANARPKLDSSAETAALFSPTRTSEDDEAVSNTAQPGDPIAAAPSPPPSLVGIAFGNRGGVALVKSTAGATTQVHTGEEIDGWRVTAITRDHAVIEREGRRVELGLEFRSDRSAVATGNPDEPAGNLAPIPLPPAQTAPR